MDEIRWGLGDVVYGLLVYVLGGLGAGLFLIVIGAIDLQTGDLGELGLGSLFVLITSGWVGLGGWPVLATYVKGRRSLALDFGFAIEPVDVGWGIGAGVAALVFSIVANLVWIAVSGGSAPDNTEFLPTDDHSVVSVLVIFGLVAVGTPIVEELFFRGLFLRSAARRLGTPLGVVVSSLVFGLLHFQGGLASGLFIVVVTASYGALFAVLAVWSRRLGPSIVAHALVNGVGVALTMFT